MPFSTDSQLPNTWPIEDFNVELMSSVLGCARADAPQLRAELGKRHRDPAWLDQTVATLSVPALSVAAMLAGRGGMMHEDDLETIARVTHGLGPAEVASGIQQLLKHLLVVPLTTGARSSIVALVASAADGLAERVAGIELVSAGDAPFVPDAKADGGRALLATATALASAELRLTTAATPHRTGLKKLAKQVGLEVIALEHLVMAALECRLVTVDEDGVILPRYDRLLAASEGNYPDVQALETLRTLPHAVAIERVSAFLMSARYRAGAMVSTEALGVLPGFVAGTVGNVAAIACAPIAGTAAASVTPSFEVFLPPESRPRDLVEVLAACEVGRIDRAIVARITKASINAAISRGATADSLIAALTAASRTPLPQNVSAAIRDWAGNAVVATITRGTTIVVAPSEEARAVGALAQMRPRVVAPGVLVVPHEVSERAVTTILRKHGIFGGLPPEPVATRATPPRPPNLRVLHARVAAYRRKDPSEPRPAMIATPPTRPPIEVVDLSVSQVLAERIERWEHQHDHPFDLDEFDLLMDVLEPLALPDRQFIFAAPDRDELASRLSDVLSRPDQLARLDADIKHDLATFGCRLRTADSKLDWHGDHVVARLEAAVRTHASMAIDLGTRICTIAVARIGHRGSALLVFGEDANAVSHAIRVSEIKAVAEAPPIGAASDPPRWRPVAGMKAPPGHIKCPCGSDKRYRECCRESS